MSTSNKLCEKRNTRKEATALAKLLSENHKDVTVYVIQSTENGEVVYYADDNDFIRSRELLIGSWLNGKEVKHG